MCLPLSSSYPPSPRNAFPDRVLRERFPRYGHLGTWLHHSLFDADPRRIPKLFPIPPHRIFSLFPSRAGLFRPHHLLLRTFELGFSPNCLIYSSLPVHQDHESDLSQEGCFPLFLYSMGRVNRPLLRDTTYFCCRLSYPCATPSFSPLFLSPKSLDRLPNCCKITDSEKSPFLSHQLFVHSFFVRLLFFFEAVL